MAESIHVSITPEQIFAVGQFIVTNAIITTFIVIGILLLITAQFRMKMSFIPNKSQALVESLFEFLYDLVRSVAPERVRQFFPFIATFFIFILISNWVGLLPVAAIGLIKTGTDHSQSLIPLIRPGTADLNTTIALALISVIATQYWGFKYLGVKLHLGKYFNFHSPIDFFVGILELIGEFVKIISFSFRLFGNIFAGEILLAVMFYMIPVLLPVPFIGLEIFVGFIQAAVFAMLTLVFFQMAVEKSH